MVKGCTEYRGQALSAPFRIRKVKGSSPTAANLGGFFSHVYPHYRHSEPIPSLDFGLLSNVAPKEENESFM